MPLSVSSTQPTTRPIPTKVPAPIATAVETSPDSFAPSTHRARIAGHAVRAALRLSDGAGLRAPDGMRIDPSALVPAPTPVPATRTDRIAAGKTAEVPQRNQQGPTCGLYALGMVMDYWNARDAESPTVLVSDKDIGGQGEHYNVEPTSDERMLDYVRTSGYTSAGEMFKARDLAETAAHFGYSANLHEDATLEALYAVLDAGHPAIVAFDVDYRGNPGDFGGKRAHYAVIEGYFDEDGERYLIARHGWGGKKDYIWKASEFDTSWKALKATDWYGTPGDGVMPDPQYEEPAKLDLPDLGDGTAGIARSLGTKIIEVVPLASKAVGGTPVERASSIA